MGEFAMCMSVCFFLKVSQLGLVEAAKCFEPNLNSSSSPPSPLPPSPSLFFSPSLSLLSLYVSPSLSLQLEPAGRKQVRFGGIGRISNLPQPNTVAGSCLNDSFC